MKVGGGVKKTKSKKGPGAKRRAKDLVDQFGCAMSSGRLHHTAAYWN